MDKERLCIMGGSAGGYTTLAVLAFRDTFQAGASLYGVSESFDTSISLSRLISMYCQCKFYTANQVKIIIGMTFIVLTVKVNKLTMHANL